MHDIESNGLGFSSALTHTTFSLAPAIFLSDYAYNCGLQHTTVASCAVLLSTTCVFVFCLSFVLKIEAFEFGKLLGVMLAVAGTVLTTVHDAQDNPDNPKNQTRDQLWGDVVSLLAAVAYAVYSVQARLFCPEKDELYSLSLILAYVGVLCAIPLLPMAVYELVLLKPNLRVFGILVVKGLLDFAVTDYLLFRAITLTNATIANVGLALTIPIAFAADFVVKQQTFSPMQIAGAFTVLLGFILVNIYGTGNNDDTVPPIIEQTTLQQAHHDLVHANLSSMSETSPEHVVI